MKISGRDSIACSFEMSGDLLEEYVAACDFMAKRRIQACTVLARLAISVILWALAVLLRGSEFAALYTLTATLLTAGFVEALACTLMRVPLAWEFRGTRAALAEKYLAAVGLPEASREVICRSRADHAGISCEVGELAICASGPDFRWVNRTKRLVLVGCSRERPVPHFWWLGGRPIRVGSRRSPPRRS